MAEQLLIRVLNMSLTGSFAILAVMAMRTLLRKAPSIFSYCLWAAVLFRLLCPISFTAFFSPLNALPAPLTEYAAGERGRLAYIPETLLPDRQHAAPHEAPGANAGPEEENGTPDPAAWALGNMGVFLKSAAAIWLAGILLMALYSLLSLARLTGKLKTAVWVRDNIYLTEAIPTPFVMGLIRPRIYLPSSLGRDEMRYILMHEQIHIRRMDHIAKIVSFATLCLHWFNPLVWLAFFLSGKDMEMSCDEAVIRKSGGSVKKEYSSSLLYLTTGKRIVNGVPLAFGEGDTGSRIRNILHYQKPTALVFGIAAALCAAATVILLANPERPEDSGEPVGSVTYYGVVTEVVSRGNSYRRLLCPGIGEVRIPEAKVIDTYFEPGDERDPHELLPGDLAAVTFPSKEDAAIQDTWPPQFSGPAESITVMWQGLTLKDAGNDSRLQENTYLFTFPGGVVPEVSDAEPGDILSIYWEKDGDGAYLPQVPGSGFSGLIANAPVLSVTENEYGGKMLTTELSESEIRRILSGFGFHIRFDLQSAHNTTR